MTGPTLDFPQARFACVGCAACCRGDWAVPVASTEADALDDFYRGSAVWLRADGPAAGFQMKNAHAGCVLLARDQSCAVHAARGAAAKPRACQLYPCSFVTTPVETTVVLGFECPGVQWPAAPDDATRTLAGRLLPRSAGVGRTADALHHSGCAVRWADYSRWRDWLLAEAARGWRPRRLVMTMVGSAAALGEAGEEWRPPTDGLHTDWLTPSGTDTPGLRRQVLALALMLAADGLATASGARPPGVAQRLRRMLRTGAAWQVLEEKHPVASLEILAEKLDDEAEQILSFYLGELLRRHGAAVGSGDLDLNVRLLMLLYRLVLLHAAALARTAARGRIEAGAMRAAVGQVDRRFALHLRVRGSHPLFELARAWGARLLGHKNYCASMV